MKNMILKQTVMNKVLFALFPIILFSIFLFGWRVLTILLFSNLTSFLTEYLMVRKKPNGKVTTACFVTATLLALTLPVSIPLWMAGVASVIAILFGKMVFGGFGTNVFNPAIVGRTFVYISFPKEMTVNWTAPFTKFPGGYLHYQTADALEKITTATPIAHLKNGIDIPPISNMFFGLTSGSIGETSALLILLSGLYLVITKTAKWQPIVACIFSFSLFTQVFYHGSILQNILSGGLLFGTIFMITDPISMAKTKYGIWIYGILVGFFTVFIRKFSLFAEGFMFALLLGNTFMPIIDFTIQKLTTKQVKQGV